MSDLTERLRRLTIDAPASGDARIAVHEAANALEEAEAKLAAIDALHRPIPNPWDNEPDAMCGHDMRPWPCPDHRILHPEDIEPA